MHIVKRPFLPTLLPVLGLAALCAVPAHADTPPKPEIAVNTTQMDTVEDFAKKAGPTARTWYPRIEAILGETGQKEPEKEKTGETAGTQPKRITILFDMDMDGVAATSGSVISVSGRYVRRHPDDMGMIVHELTHVVQAYPKYDPVWLVEGIADYVRFFHFEPKDKRPHPNPARANCRDSYRTTAAFLDWASNRYEKDLVKKLHRALRDVTYTEGLFKEITGKDLDTLNTEWKESLKAPQPE